jgi:Spy/CpxP family protein refolding chaperone
MRRTQRMLLGSLMLACPVHVGAQAHQHGAASPYADLMDREIKALSAAEVDGLLSGEGLGMALPAELNRYPGPKHVLDSSEMLGLTRNQEETVRSIFEEMRSKARELGARVVELERELERAFAEGTITEGGLDELVGEIADARGRLRASHLRAHLRLYPVLTEEQRAHYQRARGYGG